MNNVESRSTDFLIEHQAPPAVINLWTVARQMVIAAVDLYIAVTVLYFVARIVHFDAWGIIALVSEVVHLLLISAIPVVLITLLARSYRRAAALSLHGVAFLWLFGALYLPQPAPLCLDDCQSLNMMTFNITAGRAPNADLQAALLASGAEIIALQEVAPSQADYLERHLSDRYAHQSYRVNDSGGELGFGILSTYPIIDTTLYNDPETGFPSVMTATLNVNGRALRVINIHAAPPYISDKGYRSRSEATIALATEIATVHSNAPTVLLGDFNATDQSDAYQLATGAGLTDAYRAAGYGLAPTYPEYGFYALRWLQYPSYNGYKADGLSIPPLVRIDHVFVSQHFEAASAQRANDTPTDHYPIQAEIYWYFNR